MRRFHVAKLQLVLLWEEEEEEDEEGSWQGESHLGEGGKVNGENWQSLKKPQGAPSAIGSLLQWGLFCNVL